MTDLILATFDWVPEMPRVPRFARPSSRPTPTSWRISRRRIERHNRLNVTPASPP